MFLLTQTQPNASFSPNIQDIYNILSIIGFILSAGITIHTWRKSRECYHISVIDYEVHHSVFQLLIAISNCSSNACHTYYFLRWNRLRTRAQADSRQARLVRL